MMDRKKYYVNLQSREISQIKHKNNANFTIYATDQEVQKLRKTLDNVHGAELGTYWRSHIPIMQYHHDPSNDRYDKSLTEAFATIYELGDEEAKSFIAESGILDDRPIDTDH